MEKTTVKRDYKDLGLDLIVVYLVIAVQKHPYQIPAVHPPYLVKKTKAAAILKMSAQEILYADITTSIKIILDFHRTWIVALLQRIVIVRYQVKQRNHAAVNLRLAKKTLEIAILTMNVKEI